MCDVSDFEHIAVLIELNGSQRLVEYEKEIFASKGLSKLYLERLCPISPVYYREFDDEMLARYPLAARAYNYALTVLQTRWHAAELLIQQDHLYWRWYREFFGMIKTAPKLIPPSISKRELWNQNKRFSGKR